MVSQAGRAATFTKVSVVNALAVVGTTFTTPAGTTPYSIGDLVANHGTAASVVALVFAVSAAINDPVMLRRLRLKTDDTGAVGATLRLHLYKDDPALSSGITNGDNGVFLTKESTYLGAFEVVMDRHFSDAEKGIGVPVAGSEITCVPSVDTVNIFGLLEARSAFTPVGAKLWTPSLEVFR